MFNTNSTHFRKKNLSGPATSGVKPGQGAKAEDQQEQEEGGWHRGIGGRDAAGYAWIDIEPTGRALKNAIAIYKLILMMQNTGVSLKTRENLRYVEVWIDAMIPLKTCFLWLDFDGSEFEVLFKLGEC